MEKRFLGETIDVQPLPGVEGGETWLVEGSRPFPLERWLGGLSLLDWDGRGREAREAFEAELSRVGALVVWNARLGFWFRWCIAQKVPFDPTQPMAPRGYHYDDDGENPYLGLFKGFDGIRNYGTAVARTEDVQAAMQANRRVLSPHAEPEVHDENWVAKLEQWALHLQSTHRESVDYMGIAELHRALVNSVANPKDQYDLIREGRLECARSALTHLDRFYDAVDATLDQEGRRHVHDYNRFGPTVPSALFIKNSTGAHQWNRYTLPPKGAIPFLHGRTSLPLRMPIQRFDRPVRDLDYYLFGSDVRPASASDLY